MVYKYIYYSSSPTCFGPLLAFFRDALLILEKASQDFYIILITVKLINLVPRIHQRMHAV